MIALEAGRVLDERILADFETWDIRRYGSTRIAIKVIGSAPRLSAGSGPVERDRTDRRTDRDGGRAGG